MNIRPSHVCNWHEIRLLQAHGSETITEIINDIVAQIDQIIFWLRVTVYLVIGICVVWIIGFIRRNLGLDTHSMELKRIRRLLGSHDSDK